MKPLTTEASWINGGSICSLEDLASASGLAIDDVMDLVDCGVITPLEQRPQATLFQLDCLITLKTARRLRDDFQLDRHGVALALTLLRRLDALEAELKAAQARQTRPAEPRS